MHQFAPVFMKLAADALSNEMDRSAFELYALVPSTQAAIDDIKARKLQIGTIDRPFQDPPKSNRQIDVEKINADLEELKSQLRSGDPHEVIATAATAYIHENAGNTRGAFAAYEQLELYFNKSKKRENYLYNLVRTSAIIGQVLVTEKYGSIFLKTFPGSKHEESVRSMMLTSLFMEGEYEKCIEVALRLLPKLSSPSKQHDICLHVLGGSYYYTGKYDVARAHLDAHVEMYEKSSFRMAALYFQGSNLSRLQYWTAAAELLDKFLSDFPDPRQNVYLPFALYDRANCHFAEDELDPALVKLNRLESEFPNSEIMDMAYNLKGNVFQTQEEWPPAEEYYLKALELGRTPRTQDGCRRVPLLPRRDAWPGETGPGSQPAREGSSALLRQVLAGARIDFALQGPGRSGRSPSSHRGWPCRGSPRASPGSDLRTGCGARSLWLGRGHQLLHSRIPEAELREAAQGSLLRVSWH